MIMTEIKIMNEFQLSVSGFSDQDSDANRSILAEVGKAHGILSRTMV